MILQSVSAPWVKSSFLKALRQLKVQEMSESLPGANSKSKTRLSPLCARGRDDDRQKVSDMSHLV